MAGDGTISRHLRAAGRTARHTFDVRGRSSRAEYFGYVVLSQAPLVAVHWLASWFAPPALADALLLAVACLVTAPLFALSIRRLHDIGRSGWWSAPLLILVARTLLLEPIGLAAGWSVRSAIESVLSYADWLLTIPAAAVFVALMAWPARAGASTSSA
jgi:uncharacterized membrane protein YhaH (DUF805 family)